MSRDKSIKKVLVIGSGPIVIGQAAEFDYAGTQACRVLKSEGVKTVLVNSNPATIMTDGDMADSVYLEPLCEETIRRVIIKEKPDSLLAGLGGQTGLTIAMRLSHEGFLKKHNVRLIGTNADAIDMAEDRRLFKEAMARIGQPTIPSDIANDTETALIIAERIGYPVIVRPAFTLGGAGGGVAFDAEQLASAAATGLEWSPIRQVLIEKYIFGWKEIEFEVMRDHAGNTICVCSMENMDPVGIHTGDSIVVAPALTLADREYQMLRSAAIDIITELGIEGGCNCQFALDPNSFDYAVIEVNPRVSRSSALASKATGYPIAKVSVKIALGYTLDEINNDITGKTTACFEPAIDYVVVKFPKWPFDKFHGASRRLGSQMKATGEVMSIAHTFEEALMKAVRGAEIGQDTLNRPYDGPLSLSERLDSMDDLRLFTVFEALKAGYSVDDIFAITRIDRWFLNKLKNLAAYEESLKGKKLTKEPFLAGKRMGYTDTALKRLSGNALPTHLLPSYKMVDTCAAEFQAQTPYFYASYDSCCDSRSFPRSGAETVIVLGSGPIRIGQGIEFDYSSVHCVRTLKDMGYDVVIINNNPETVSTDYDTADRLYFEPLSPEDVMGVIEAEKPVGVVVAFGGQTAIKLTDYLDRQGIKILGTSAEGIDLAEDRGKFDALLETLGIRRPKGFGVHSMQEALSAAEQLGYPVLLRPSYVIGGQNMVIALDRNDVERYMSMIISGGSAEYSVLVDKYMPGTELEVDVISDGQDVLMPGIMEHIERAGIHSGDSIAVYPPYSLTDMMMETVVNCSEKLALALGTRGLVNIQYLIYDNELFVIEVNPRASRTVPYLSKVTGIPMVDIASRVMMGQTIRGLGYTPGLCDTPPYYAVKLPVFSFEKLGKANSVLGPEMKSTGEVLGLGRTLGEAVFKGFAAAGYKTATATELSKKAVLLSVENHELPDVIGLVKKLSDLKLKIYATPDTAQTVRSLGIKAFETSRETWSELTAGGELSLIVYTGALYDDTMNDYLELHTLAVRAGVPCITSLDTANAMADMLASRYNVHNTELVNLNDMRTERRILKFAKMHGSGNDYIFFDNREPEIFSPESLSVSICDRHYGIGGYGIVLIEKSDVADAKMRIFNRDGSEGQMAGNSIRCVGKYLYDKNIVRRETLTIETGTGIKTLRLYIRNGRVSTVSVNMGRADLDPASLPSTLEGPTVIDRPVMIGGTEYKITCASVGNPHCVVFCDDIDSLDLEKIGPEFENAEYFPQRINTEFVRVVSSNTLRMRVFERGNGETWACGTGACAAVIAATEKNLCKKGVDVTVKLKGGDLIVNYTDDAVILTGDAVMVYEGSFEF